MQAWQETPPQKRDLYEHAAANDEQRYLREQHDYKGWQQHALNLQRQLATDGGGVRPGLDPYYARLLQQQQQQQQHYMQQQQQQLGPSSQARESSLSPTYMQQQQQQQLGRQQQQQGYPSFHEQRAAHVQLHAQRLAGTGSPDVGPTGHGAPGPGPGPEWSVDSRGSHPQQGQGRAGGAPGAQAHAKRELPGGSPDPGDALAAGPPAKRPTPSSEPAPGTNPPGAQATVAVMCGAMHGRLHIADQRVACECQACELKPEAERLMSCTQFEVHAGAGSAKKWKTSLKVPPGAEPEVRAGGNGMPIGRWLDLRGYEAGRAGARPRQEGQGAGGGAGASPAQPATERPVRAVQPRRADSTTASFGSRAGEAEEGGQSATAGQFVKAESAAHGGAAAAAAAGSTATKPNPAAQLAAAAWTAGMKRPPGWKGGSRRA